MKFNFPDFFSIVLHFIGSSVDLKRISKADITGHWWLVKWLIVDGYFCFLFFNLTTASRLCQQYTSIEETEIYSQTCYLTDQNYRCASSVQTIFSISSFLLFRLHTASTVVQRWSTSVVVNSNLHCLVSVYSVPLQADATF
ncbi:hypothetical protein T4B_14604 [Trichinella pseudospiralis]|uniref:Uncharacterized protein n=1 Tax=Trichinella pseudospiralis TaxID=6337 RepID=A0A0V1J0G2_TRIPS|nr:hypothetical protein T4B_14604 [Trichinella pseudospiralis]